MDLLNAIQLYFRGGKIESALMLAVSIFLFATAMICFLLLKHPLAKGLAAMLLLAALVGSSVGGAS